MFLFYLFVLSSILSHVSSENTTNATYKIVNTKNGAIRGLKMKTFYNNISYISFRGIPFAKPPIGELRFKVYIYFYLYLKRSQLYKKMFLSRKKKLKSNHPKKM